ncbi:hypothetical protein [Mesorhizobium sp. NPDC059025]|uniref:hypothetical protein n=1 Tax=unclassified Mesorhizobium TaxID=325217 RepID=UPI0036A741BF
MHNSLVKPISLSALTLAMASSVAFGASPLSHLSRESIDGAGRNIMRTADGGLVSTYSVADGQRLDLVFSASLDNGESWNETVVKGVDGKVHQAAIDSNFQGSYVAFTEERDGVKVGRIAFASAPFAEKPEITVSDAVTPAGVEAQDTFIQASRKGWGNLSDQARETVVYGWQDKNSKSLYIGVSTDGRTFPAAKKVVEDTYATSGPAVAIRGNFVIATYQTTNPAFAPADVASDAASQRSYPAWIESMDGGQTWSAPKPLFGLKSADYPVVKVEAQPGQYDNLRLAGGTTQPNSPILNWGGIGDPGPFVSRDAGNSSVAEDKSGSADLSQMEHAGVADVGPNDGITFVQTSMMSMDSAGRKGEVSIVSFRQIKPNAPWTHVIANNKLSNSNQDAETSRLGVATSHFQYSALIDTPVRATTYKESGNGDPRLVVAVSTDTGKVFNRHVSFSPDALSKLGVDGFDKTAVFSASQCLFEDRNGDVYVDLLVSQDENTRYARLPIGVNARQLRAAEKPSGT